MLKKLKKTVCIIFACLLLLLSLGSCGRDGTEEEGLSIVCTVFPLYDWIKNTVGEDSDAEIFWLTDGGTDLHSFQPSAEDMIRIATADLVVYVGGSSDGWIEEALKNSSAKGLALSRSEGVTLRAVSSESGHSHEDGHGHETDEHIWLSLRNAEASVRAICRALAESDPEGAERYRANSEEYIGKLRALDASYAAAVAEAEDPRLIVADRFPFVYLTEDYGIEYAAAFSGCTTDVDADLAMVIRLADRIGEWKAERILITERSDGSLAESVIRASGIEGLFVERMNSLQSVDAKSCAEGMTYLSAMEENLAALRRILGVSEAKE